MIALIIILVMLVVVLLIALAVSLRSNSNGSGSDDISYMDQNGDHVYYDESIIEKKRFSHLHPKEAARTFNRLFRRK